MHNIQVEYACKEGMPNMHASMPCMWCGGRAPCRSSGNRYSSSECSRECEGRERLQRSRETTSHCVEIFERRDFGKEFPQRSCGEVYRMLGRHQSRSCGAQQTCLRAQSRVLWRRSEPGVLRLHSQPVPACRGAARSELGPGGPRSSSTARARGGSQSVGSCM